MRISITEFMNRPRIDLRFFYKGDDGEFHPSKQGVNIEDPKVLDDVIQTLERAREALRKSV